MNPSRAKIKSNCFTSPALLSGFSILHISFWFKTFSKSDAWASKNAQNYRVPQKKGTLWISVLRETVFQGTRPSLTVEQPIGCRRPYTLKPGFGKRQLRKCIFWDTLYMVYADNICNKKSPPEFLKPSPVVWREIRSDGKAFAAVAAQVWKVNLVMIQY